MRPAKRTRAKSWVLTRAALERFLIANGEPEDVVITGISPKSMNQEAWQVTASSAEYPLHGDMDMIATAGHLDFLSTIEEAENG